MTADVATVRRETALKDAARALAERRISGMPVLDDAQAVVGVLSEADVLGKERTDSTRTSAPRRAEDLMRGRSETR